MKYYYFTNSNIFFLDENCKKPVNNFLYEKKNAKNAKTV